MAPHMRAELVIEALQAAVAARSGQAAGAIFHADRGSRYTAAAFAQVCYRQMVPGESVQQLTAESTTLKHRVQQLTREHRNLQERLEGARSNLRVAEKRTTDLEVQVLELQQGRGGDVARSALAGVPLKGCCRSPRDRRQQRGPRLRTDHLVTPPAPHRDGTQSAGRGTGRDRFHQRTSALCAREPPGSVRPAAHVPQQGA